jgi:nitrogen fixation protein NifU and related proteins
VSNLDALYQEVILEHNRRPRNSRVMDDASRSVHQRNPTCGDEITLYVRLDGDRIDDVSFQAVGCAISRASASLMTSAVKGKTVGEAEALFGQFHEMVTGKLPHDEARSALGSLAALSGVSRFPLRVKCASMAWHALKSGLAGE